MYTMMEYADMYLIYGECRSNAEMSARVYAERYPHRSHPTRNVFVRLDSRLRSTGQLLPLSHGGKPSTISVNTEEAVLQCVEEDPTTSCRKIARKIGCSKTTANRILRNNKFHPFHFSLVQKLLPNDLPLRVEFCNKILQLHSENENFLASILWTDESLFTREGIYNRHNYHYYDEENPLVKKSRSFQERWKVNVWGGIAGQRVFIRLLPDVLNSQQYAVFLEEVLPEILEDVSLSERPLWFQQDGAPPHSARHITSILNNTFGDKWFGQYGPHRWPPRSPDLSPLDFFLWGFLKEKVYETEPQNEEELVARLHAALTMVTGEMLQVVQREIINRAETCIAFGGDCFEPALL